MVILFHVADNFVRGSIFIGYILNFFSFTYVSLKGYSFIFSMSSVFESSP